MIVALSLLFLVTAFLGYRLWQIEKKMRVLFGGAQPKTLESLVGDHHRHLEKLRSESISLQKAVLSLESDFLKSVQKVGVVRFNPFADSGAGGDQSFAIALLDGDNNGVALSGIYVQGRPMMYAKPIERGASRYALSKEEQEALGQAGALN
ncbi:MAG: DUF4446 family protein [Patescibacteria group bacterium]